MNVRRTLARLGRTALVLVALLPFVPALVVHMPAFGWLGRACDAWFRFQCEREPARMLGVGAVCARCLGLYVGLGLGALVARPRLASPRLELWLAVAVLAMLADVASEAFGFRSPFAALRFATGLALAYPAGVILVAWLDGVGTPSMPTRAGEAAQNP